MIIKICMAFDLPNLCVWQFAVCFQQIISQPKCSQKPLDEVCFDIIRIIETQMNVYCETYSKISPKCTIKKKFTNVGFGSAFFRKSDPDLVSFSRRTERLRVKSARIRNPTYGTSTLYLCQCSVYFKYNWELKHISLYILCILHIDKTS